MPGLDQCILDKCKQSWDEEFLPGATNKNNCSGFVKSVAKKLGAAIPETANADGIVDAISKSWTKLGSGAEAGQKAATGTFVIAGLKASDHTPARNNGHVAIVVDGALYRNKYPACWCGSTGGAQSQGEKSIGEVWNRTDRDNVAYYAYLNPVCKA
jgi:hypothetical protein